MKIVKTQLKDLQERLATQSPESTYILAQDSVGGVAAQKVKLSNIYSQAIAGIYNNPTFTGRVAANTVLGGGYVRSDNNGNLTFNEDLGYSEFKGVVKLPNTSDLNSLLNTIRDVYPLTIPLNYEGYVVSASNDGTTMLRHPINNLTYNGSIPEVLDARQGYLLDQNKAPKENPIFTGTAILPSTTSIGNVSATEIGYINGVDGNIQEQLNSKVNSHGGSSDYVETYTASCNDISKYRHGKNCILDISSTIPFNGDSNFVFTETWIDGSSSYYQTLISSTGKKYSRIFYFDNEYTTPWTTVVSDNNIAPLSNPEFTGTIKLNGEEIYADGTNYLMVYGTGTPTKNAAELQAAYNEAKKMPRFIGVKSSNTPIQMYAGQTYGIFTGSYIYYKVLVDGAYNPLNIGGAGAIITEAQAKSTRTTVIVAPGEYNFGASAFVVDTPYINIVSLTGNPDVIINSTEENSIPNYKYGIKVAANDIFIKGIDCKPNAFYVEDNLNNIICEYCIGGKYSFGHNRTASGTFNYCTGDDESFGGNGTASGIFNYCKGGDYSFGCGGTSIASGIFNNCVGGSMSFGTYGTASGTFNYCTGDNESFGDNGGTLSGELINCKLTSGTFQTPTGEGKIYNCIDGNGSLVNYPLIQDLNGTNYLMVYGVGTPEENAAELQAAYDAAKLMLPTTDNVITIVVAPGKYTFSSQLNHNTEYIDIVSLTGNPDVILSLDINLNPPGYSNFYSTLYINASNTFIKGIGNAYVISEGEEIYYSIIVGAGLTNVKVENCFGGEGSFGSFSGGEGDRSGCTFINCTGYNSTINGQQDSDYYYCKGVFRGPFTGKIYNCIDSSGNLVNTKPVIIPNGTGTTHAVNKSQLDAATKIIEYLVAPNNSVGTINDTPENRHFGIYPFTANTDFDISIAACPVGSIIIIKIIGNYTVNISSGGGMTLDGQDIDISTYGTAYPIVNTFVTKLYKNTASSWVIIG